MAKIVYNSCYGGFGLSDAAIKRYAELKGISIYLCPGYVYRNLWAYTETDDSFDCDDIARHDHCLVQVVEELGINAYGPHARLDILDVPDGARYNIDEYDGMETVILERDMVWSVAE
jgi:hypothetical protein